MSAKKCHADSLGNLVGRNFVAAGGSRSRPLLMGIDPGFSGACAVYDLDRRVLVDMIDMPLFQTKTKSRKSGQLNHLDVHKLSSLLDQYAPHTAAAILEEPGAMPNQGLSSTFRFGHTCGQIHGVLAGHYVPTIPVKPGVWKSALALSHEKDDSRRLASHHFPEFTSLWKLKLHNDRAEAALLCVYAHRYLASTIQLSR